MNGLITKITKGDLDIEANAVLILKIGRPDLVFMKEKLYLDTFVFMDILSGEVEAKKAETYLEKMKGGIPCIVSSILFAELAFHIRRKRGREHAEEILMYIKSLPNLEIVPVSSDIAKGAGFLRSHYMKRIPKKLTYFDCVHIATALAAGCTKFVTGDRGFKDVKEIEMEIY